MDAHRYNKRHLARRIAGLGLTCALVLSSAGCDDTRIDSDVFKQGMDRSAIVGRLGAPDKRKSHDHIERLTYQDGEHYQYLLLLTDGKLTTWYHDRVYKKSKFSQIRSGLDAGP